MGNIITIRAKSGGRLELGHQGENNARQVVFDNLLSHWRSVYGPGTVQLIVQRGGEKDPYPATLNVDGNTATWVITAADTAIPGGCGRAELRYMVGDTLAKSEVWPTIVLDALGEPSETPPEPQKAWVDQVLQAGAEAQEAAKRAEEAAAHQPYPNAETGTWWVWDVEKGEYVDSGISYGTEIETADSTDALSALAACGILTPAYQDGTFYTDADGAIYVL